MLDQLLFHTYMLGRKQTENMHVANNNCLQWDQEYHISFRAREDCILTYVQIAKSRIIHKISGNVWRFDSCFENYLYACYMNLSLIHQYTKKNHWNNPKSHT